MDGLKFEVPFANINKFPLTKEQERYNRAVRAIRSRVESPFSVWKKTFKALDLPFSEGEDQQNKLVQIAAGVFNESKIN